MILKTKISNIYSKEIHLLHNHQTRQGNMLQTIKFKSNIGKKSLLFNGVINKMNYQKKFKKIKSIRCFKVNLKKHLLK